MDARGTPELRTERLVLRGWRDADREPYAALNADARVMEHMPALMTREQCDAHIESIARHFAEHGFGLWAVEVTDEAPFIGFVGLSVPSFEASFTPCVEIGWRLAAPAWGRGYATEAARECLRYAFVEAELDEVVSFTTVHNVRSRAVMERIGMTRDSSEDFDHPRLPAGHPVRPHVLYRISATAWSAGPGAREPRAR